ncbi:DUF503 domain-containing protein [uncultured Anaerococcus sp.]|uniref:DUF503 domain-containing protein n=1 Tax=uncultured Anaerococcus sp. TaxID=293428 RepID=UPI00280BC1C9|nr:DUF503 domain-containing protein [uncultured Anaerococcus sp.]
MREKLRRIKIYLYLLEVRIKIYDSFSLKDKRRTVKSILDYSRNNLSISASEVSDHEFVNMASLAFVSVSNDNDFSKSLLEKVIKRIEENYQVEILEENIQRLL